jgi:hypothetical protein
VWLALTGCAVLLFAGFSALMSSYPGDQTWACGFAGGALFATLYALRQTPPGVIERWQEGAWGEELTAKELTRLTKSGWTVLNDVGHGQYNFDHILISAKGVYCLNSKRSACTLEVDKEREQLRLSNRYDPSVTWREDRMLAQARRDAATVSRLILDRTGQRVWVSPVIVWWGRYDQQGRTVRKVGVVHGHGHHSQGASPRWQQQAITCATPRRLVPP